MVSARVEVFIGNGHRDAKIGQNEFDGGLPVPLRLVFVKQA